MRIQIRLLHPVRQLILTFGLALPLFSAPPDADFSRAQDLLLSPRLIDKAWGADMAGANHMEALTGLLIFQLRAAAPYRAAAWDGEEYACVQALLDTLIRLNAIVPADAIMPFRERWRVEAIILLSRNAQAAEDGLLAMRQEKLQWDEWLAVNNVLLRLRSPRRLERTLSELIIIHYFTVVDSPPMAGGIPGGIDGYAGPPPYRKFPQGFPVSRVYQFMLKQTEGFTLFAEGPHDVFYAGVPVTTVRAWHHPGYLMSGSQEDRVEYMARLGNITSSQAHQLFRASTTIKWTNSAEFERLVDWLLEQQIQDIRKFTTGTEKRLHASFPDMQLAIKTRVFDARVAKREPLPDIAVAKGFSLRPQ